MASSSEFTRLLRPVLHIKKKMELELTCPICSKLLSEPVVLPCGHVFCSQCIRTEDVFHENRCLSCPSPYSSGVTGGRSQMCFPHTNVPGTIQKHGCCYCCYSSEGGVLPTGCIRTQSCCRRATWFSGYSCRCIKQCLFFHEDASGVATTTGHCRRHHVYGAENCTPEAILGSAPAGIRQVGSGDT